jgi:hypothetical protein
MTRGRTAKTVEIGTLTITTLDFQQVQALPMEVEVQKSACNFVKYDFFPSGTVWAHFAHIGYNSIVIQLHIQNMEYASTQILADHSD